MYTSVYSSLPVYSYLPKFTGVYLCLVLFNCATLHIATPVYSCLPIFIRVYLFTCSHVYSVTYV